MKYCTRCVYPENHPLGITFDENGVCSGCLVHEEKYNSMNWTEKGDEFRKIIEPYTDVEGTSYDCIIPVVGSGDDFYVVDLVKNKFGMNPLLVTYNSHFNTKVGIRNLARLLTELDCDHISSTVGPKTVKKVTKATIELIGDMYWHVNAGSQTFPVQVATKLNIPLIIWGCHYWQDQVGHFFHYDVVEMTKKVRKEHALRMLDAEELVSRSKEVTKEDVLQFKYPSDAQLEKHKVRGIYISNFFFWNSKEQTESMIEEFGFESAPQNRTYNTYDTIHCHNNAEIHDYLKYLKFGYGKATDHVCRDIRLKRMTREEGIELVMKYDSKEPSDLGRFLTWLGMSKEEFYGHIDSKRDPAAWEKIADKWHIKDCVGNHRNDQGIESVRLEKSSESNYKTTKLLEEEDGKYILTGRTYLDEKNNYKALED